LTITTNDGKVILKENLMEEIQIGENHLEKNVKPFVLNGIYFVTLQVGKRLATQKIIVKP
jgi:hypothetical protein